MKKFASLFDQLDQTQSTNEKVVYIQNYFVSCSDAEGAWALFFLCGHRLKRFISTKKLLEWAAELTLTPSWLAAESHAAVGDTAETIALLLPHKTAAIESSETLAEWMENTIKPLKGLSEESQKAQIVACWLKLNTTEIFILNKILTGAFRVGISALLTIKALSLAIDIPREVLALRLMGNWEPTASFFASLKSQETATNSLNPYPFYLAHPLEQELSTLGSLAEWLVEWKWDGIRGQAVIRNGQVALWSRGNELVSDQFPELIEAFKAFPDGTVVDGEILAFQSNRPLPFGELQQRLNRKNVSKLLIEKVPVAFMIYDLLEHAGKDMRAQSLTERRKLIQHLPATSSNIVLSQEISCSSWQEVQNFRLQARDNASEGLMLKRRTSTYGTGRQKGHWWKHKVDALTLDAVLIYAQAGAGRRANLFTDYTFAVWQDKELVPIAKAYSGLTQAEINELDTWIRKNTEEKFGPARKVKPFHVFEIAFEGIQISKRHKSGLALRFPRILRWRKDKPYQECDSLSSIKEAFSQWLV